MALPGVKTWIVDTVIDGKPTTITETIKAKPMKHLVLGSEGQI